MSQEVYEGHGKRTDGQNEVVSMKNLLGTIFYRPDEQLNRTRRFFALGENNVSANWQTVSLPIRGAYRYDVDALCVEHNLILAASSATLLANHYKALEASTRIVVDDNKSKELYVFSMSDLVGYRWHPAVAADGTFSVQQAVRQNQWMPLDEWIQFGTGGDLQIKFDPPAGNTPFTCATYSSSTTPLLPDSGLAAVSGGAAAERGFYVQLRMHSVEGAQG